MAEMSQALLAGEESALERIEAYLDAAPRSAADTEPIGPFTLFRAHGPWQYYARPRLGLDEPISADDVSRLRSRQRELGLPETIEWVVEATPSLADVAREAGLEVAEYPLMELDRAAFVALGPPLGIAIRLLPDDDPDFVRVHAVAAVGFGVPGTATGREGGAERDARAESSPATLTEFQRRRARDGWSVSFAAFDDDGPVCVGTHQPVGDVTEVVGVATLPQARRRGIGAALTSVLVEDALARGVEMVFLSAGSDDVARVYARLGFRRIGMAGAAEPPEPVQARPRQQSAADAQSTSGQ
jgi:N-acetylglutamate synthase-like GNAT family acetyltransferase